MLFVLINFLFLIKNSFEKKKASHLRSLKEDIDRNTPGMSQKLNRSISVRDRDETLMDISMRLQDYKRRKSVNIKKIVTKMNQVINYILHFIVA